MVEPALMESMATRVPVLRHFMDSSAKIEMNVSPILVKMAELV